METYTYPVMLSRDDNDTFLVSFPDFPEAHTFGETKEEALERAIDALATIIDAYIKDRQPIPRPSKITRAAVTVTLPALTTSKVALYEAMRGDQVGKAELAKRLNWHLPQVDRLLDVHHASRLDQMESAFEALGRRMRVVIETNAPPRATMSSLTRATRSGSSSQSRGKRHRKSRGKRHRAE